MKLRSKLRKKVNCNLVFKFLFIFWEEHSQSFVEIDKIVWIGMNYEYFFFLFVYLLFFFSFFLFLFFFFHYLFVFFFLLFFLFFFLFFSDGRFDNGVRVQVRVIEDTFGVKFGADVRQYSLCRVGVWTNQRMNHAMVQRVNNESAFAVYNCTALFLYVSRNTSMCPIVGWKKWLGFLL